MPGFDVAGGSAASPASCASSASDVPDSYWVIKSPHRRMSRISSGIDGLGNGDLDDGPGMLTADQDPAAGRPLGGAPVAEDHPLARVTRQDQPVGADVLDLREKRLADERPGISGDPAGEHYMEANLAGLRHEVGQR